MKKNLINFTFFLWLPGLTYAGKDLTSSISESETVCHVPNKNTITDETGTYYLGPSHSGQIEGTPVSENSFGFVGQLKKRSKNKKKNPTLQKGFVSRDRAPSTDSDISHASSGSE